MRKSDSLEQPNPKGFVPLNLPHELRKALFSLSSLPDHLHPQQTWAICTAGTQTRFVQHVLTMQWTAKSTTTKGRISSLQVTAENKTVLTGFSSGFPCQSWGQPTRPALTPVPRSAPVGLASTTKIGSSVRGTLVCSTHGKYSQSFPPSLQNVTHHSYWSATFSISLHLVSLLCLFSNTAFVYCTSIANILEVLLKHNSIPKISMFLLVLIFPCVL